MAIAHRSALEMTADLASSPLVDIMREKRGQKQCLCVCVGVWGDTRQEQETRRGRS